MKELKTIHGVTFIVDDEDYEKAKQYRWYIRKRRKERIHVITLIYNKETQEQKSFTYKRLILGIKSKYTLYKNNNPLDLRRENILAFDNTSETTKARNIIYNTYKKTEHIQSKYIGVTHKPVQMYPLCPWKTEITCNGKIYSLGSFANEEEAAMAYDQKALEFFGTNANRNFPNLTLEELTQNLNIIREKNKTVRAKKHSKEIQGKRVRTKIKKHSKYVGVSYNSEFKLWIVSICHRRKMYYLDSFYNEDDAALAYDQKAIELYGLEAKRNFPELTVEELTQKLNIARAEKEFIKFDKMSKNSQGQQDRNIIKTSKYAGVDWVKRFTRNNWRSRIRRYNKEYSLGRFDNEEEAARAYDKKALELYGESAKLNFPRK